jgi:hypothetical protein
VDLPEGDYTLRVGGAMNKKEAGNTFTFCKQVNQKAAPPDDVPNPRRGLPHQDVREQDGCAHH